MDTSAFDVDTGGDLNLNLAELYHDLPEDVQNTIVSILCLARSFAKVGLLVAAWACCASAFCLLIVWICLYWLLVHLLLCLTVVLTFTFEVNDSTGDADGERRASDESLRTEQSKKTPEDSAGKDHDAKPDRHTSADLDLFEAFLNAPRDSTTSTQRQIEVQDPIHQSRLHYKTPAGQEQEESLLGAEEVLQEVPARGEIEALEVREDLKSNSPSQEQDEIGSDGNRRLPFEPQLTGTADQLKEAANLHAEFTKGGSSGRHSNKHVSHAKTFQRHAGATNAAAAKAPIRSLSQVASANTTRTPIPMLTHNIENSDTRKSIDAVLPKARTLPPHLRGKANAQKREENGGHAGDEYRKTISVGQEIIFDKTQAAPTSSTELPDTQQRETTELGPNEDVDGYYSASKTLSDTGRSNPLSFAEVLKMDQGELSKKLTNIIGEGSAQVAIRDRTSDPTPPITKPAERAMSIEHMKKLHNAKRDEEDCSHCSQKIDANTLEKIQRLAKITRTQAGYDAIPLEDPRKMKAMQKRMHNITMLESELNPAHVDLARCIASEKAIQMQAAAEERARAADEHGRTVRTNALERHRRVAVALSKASHQHDVKDKDIQQAASLDTAERCISNSLENTTNVGPSWTFSGQEHPIPYSKSPTPNSSSHQSVSSDGNEQGHERGCGTFAPVTSELLTNSIAADSATTSFDQTQPRTVEADDGGFNAATLPTFSGIRLMEPSTREDALRQVVEAINKQVPDKVAPSGTNYAVLPVLDDRNSSGASQGGDALCQIEFPYKQVPGQVETSTKDHHLDQFTKPDGPSSEPETTKDASSHSECSQNLFNANSDGNSSSLLLSRGPIRVKLPNSLSPQAPEFQPHFKSKEPNATNATKHSTLRPSSDTFVPSVKGYAQVQSAAGGEAFSAGDDLTTPDANPYTFNHSYSNSRLEETNCVSFPARQPIPPASQLVPQVGNVSFDEAQAHQLQQLTETTWANVDTLTSNERSSEYDLRSKTHTGRSASDESFIAPASGSLANSAVDSLSEPPGLQRRDGFNQQAFDGLLDDSPPSNEPEPATGSRPAEGMSAISTNDEEKPETKVAEAQAAQKNLESPTKTISILDVVKDCFRDRPDIYNEFLNTARDVTSGAIGLPDAVDRIRKLFADHADLIESLKDFLQGTHRSTATRSDPDRFEQPGLDDEDSQSADIDDSKIGSIAGSEHDVDVNHSTNFEDPADPAADEPPSVNTIKKKRQKARTALREAASEREVIRKRVASTWSLDGLKSLEDATKTYMLRRSELATCMASGELNQDDVDIFPVLRSNDLAAPKRGEYASTISSKGQKGNTTKAGTSMENAHPRAAVEHPLVNQSISPLLAQATLDSVLEEAFDAKDKYIEALEYLNRPPPQRGGNINDVQKPYEARIQAAAKRYRNKINAVKALFPDGEVPAEIDEMLEVFDDKDEKELRDVTLGGGIPSCAPGYISRQKKRSAPRIMRKG